MAMASAENNYRAQNVEPKLDRPIMRQLIFDWSSTEIRNFRMEVLNVFQNSKIGQAERVPNHKNWLGREGLQILETLGQAEQDTCNEEKHLLKTLSSKYKL